MEIADASAALTKVQRFIVILERGQKEWPSDSTAPYIKTWRSNEILEMLPLIVRIAARVDTDLAAKLQEESDGWPYQQTLKAAPPTCRPEIGQGCTADTRTTRAGAVRSEPASVDLGRSGQPLGRRSPEGSRPGRSASPV